ncbi:MAG: hypothetical protein J6Y37_01920 [Paludibacteraceae bacterium]|nr:hypothetical protein [Paludibacteraceae bacterium]
MAYPCFKLSLGTPGQNFMYLGDGVALYLVATGSTAAIASTNLSNATTNKWVIRSRASATTFWVYSPMNNPYIAVRTLQVNGVSTVRTCQILTGSTATSAATLSIGGSFGTRYPTEAQIYDLWNDRKTNSTSNWISNDVEAYTSYEDSELCSAQKLSTYSMFYGTGTTQWGTTAMGSRYAVNYCLGFSSAWESGFQTYYTSQPATDSGYTINVGSFSEMRVNNNVPLVSSGYLYIMYCDVQGHNNFNNSTLDLVSSYSNQQVSNGGTSYLSFQTHNTSLSNQEKFIVGLEWYFTADPYQVFTVTVTPMPASAGLSAKQMSFNADMGSFTYDFEWTLTQNVTITSIRIQFT